MKRDYDTLYEKCGFAHFKMKLYDKQLDKYCIWYDMEMKSTLGFAEKYMDKDFIKGLRKKSKTAYKAVMNLLREFKDTYSNKVEPLFQLHKFSDVDRMVQAIMDHGDRIGFKPNLIKLLNCVIPVIGVTNRSSPVIPREVFKKLFDSLPDEWVSMRSRCFDFKDGKHLHDVVICGMIEIAARCITDSIRLMYSFFAGENGIYENFIRLNYNGPILTNYYSRKNEKRHKNLIAEPACELTEYSDLLRRNSLHRNGGSQNCLKMILLHGNARKDGITLMFPKAEHILTVPAKMFFESYLSIIRRRLVKIIASGEYKYLSEHMFGEYRGTNYNHTNGKFIYSELAEFTERIAKRILNTDKMLVFDENVEFFAGNLTAENYSTNTIYSNRELKELVNGFNPMSRAKINELMNSDEKSTQQVISCIIRFVLHFCASIIRTSFETKMDKFSNIISIKYDGIDGDFKMSNWMKHTAIEEDICCDNEESMEVTEEGFGDADVTTAHHHHPHLQYYGPRLPSARPNDFLNVDKSREFVDSGSVEGL